ncbi:MAG: prephenate dehydrogenase [Myxococcota bacterium]
MELAFVGRLFTQDPDLYAEIEMGSPVGEAMRAHFLAAAGEVSALIATGDRAGFRPLFEDVSTWFEVFDAEAQGLSHHVIDTLVARP